MRRYVLLSILLLWVSGCSVICPQQKQALLEDEVEFGRAFDQFQRTRTTNDLQLFRKAYPESLWAERAGTVILYSKQLEQKKRQIEQLKQQQKQKLEQQSQQLEVLQASEKQLSADIEKLKGENRQLTEKLEQLKGLLIQLEAQPQ